MKALPSGSSPPILLLDRDGVINFDSDAYIKSVDEWIPIPGSIEAIARLSHAGYRIAVASNQSGLGRGLFSLLELNAMHQKLRELVGACGGRIELIAFCPHRPEEGCICRKPKPGLLFDIAKRLGCELRGVPFIGDSLNDITAARGAGATPWLVRTGKGERTLARLAENAGAPSRDETDIHIFDDLAEAAGSLLHQSRHL